MDWSAVTKGPAEPRWPTESSLPVGIFKLNPNAIFPPDSVGGRNTQKRAHIVESPIPAVWKIPLARWSRLATRMGRLAAIGNGHIKMMKLQVVFGLGLTSFTVET